ncbi:hypothetical protein AURANDRAFT_68793, partial [Aureococcus anophagefferens]
HFDACGGHVFLADRGYHYHSASSCVLAAMDVGGLDELLVGWALDGFGLYAVLDAAGALSDPMHDLDECRGAAVLGEYRYYVTASLPHAPPCLRGAFEAPTRAVASPLVACPKKGRNVTYFRNATRLSDPLDCPTPRDGALYPTFLFRTAPRGGPGSWRLHALAFGALFALVGGGTLLVVVGMWSEGLWPGVATYAGGQIVLAGLVCGLRAACLLADPYWADEAWSALTYGGLWGVCYPMMDVVLLLELWHACEITAAVSPQVFAGVPAPLMLLLGSASRASAVGDFGIQFMADYLRSRGNGWEWLKICQIYYVVLGLLTCVALSYVAAKLSGGARELRTSWSMRVFLFRLTCKLGYIAVFGAALCVTSCIGLDRGMDLSDSAYFLLTTQQRLFEALLCVAVVYAALPTHWALERCFPDARDDEKDEYRDSNLSFSSTIIGDVTAQFTPSGAASKLDLECDEEADYRASMDWRDGAAVRAPADVAAVAAVEVLDAPAAAAEDAAAYAVELEAAATAESPASVSCFERAIARAPSSTRSLGLSPGASSRSLSTAETAVAVASHDKKRPTEELLDDALRVVRLMEALPMRVMDLADFAAFGKIPRSSDGLARDRRDGDYVVFVSHRWWGPTTPDADFHGSDGRDATRVKYGLIKRGIEAIVRKEKLDRSRVCVWMDFACIEQDDAKTQKLGVQSLIAWASRVDVLLVPVLIDLCQAMAKDKASTRKPRRRNARARDDGGTRRATEATPPVRASKRLSVQVSAAASAFLVNFRLRLDAIASIFVNYHEERQEFVAKTEAADLIEQNVAEMMG